jgi:CHAP domain
MSTTTVATVAAEIAGNHEMQKAAQIWGAKDRRSNEWWCADYVKYCWMNAGETVVDYVDGQGNSETLSAAAGSFYDYGQYHHTLHDTPHVGDAVVFDYGYKGAGTASHVAIVTAVNGNDISVENGDGGSDGDWTTTWVNPGTIHDPHVAHPDANGNMVGGTKVGSQQICGFISAVDADAPGLPLQGPDLKVYVGAGQKPVAVAGASYAAGGQHVITGSDDIRVGPDGLPLAGQGDQVEGGGYIRDENPDNVHMGRST